MAGRPITNRMIEWSDDHRFLLAKLATDVHNHFMRTHRLYLEVWDLMIIGWLLHLRKCRPDQLHGIPITHAKTAMYRYGMRELKWRP
jgi:hypothetical protein